MQQSDYLLRQIEQLGRVLGKILARLLGLKEEGKAHQGMACTTELFRDELELDLRELISVPEEEFIQTLSDLPHWNNNHLSTFADILLELAEGLEMEGENELGTDLYKRVLLIFGYLDEKGAVFSLDSYYKKERILNRV